MTRKARESLLMALVGGKLGGGDRISMVAPEKLKAGSSCVADYRDVEARGVGGGGLRICAYPELSWGGNFRGSRGGLRCGPGGRGWRRRCRVWRCLGTRDRGRLRLRRCRGSIGGRGRIGGVLRRPLSIFAPLGKRRRRLSPWPTSMAVSSSVSRWAGRGKHAALISKMKSARTQARAGHRRYFF